MRYCFIFIAFVSLLCSCKGTQPVDDADVLVKVKDRTLRRSEIKQQIPRGLSSADSMLLAESLERKWVKDALVYDVALRNLEGEDKAEVDKLVEEYRHSLIRYRYQEQLISWLLINGEAFRYCLNFCLHLWFLIIRYLQEFFRGRHLS